ncbi:MAG: L-2-hydroxyglutarate oxidase [Micrococcales bacterium]|nr:MAG: L-2-hydroxyglutarate oxidase [Micrococcales bacterium]
MSWDYIVIGGGIVGLATAMTLLEREPGAAVVVLEKETRLGFHQTGHNSGVIHAGVYYAPGSLKAAMCKEGAQITKDFCRKHDIPFQETGKMIVATDDLELSRMAALQERSIKNGLEVHRLSASELVAEEPNIVGVGALLYPASGITDYGMICEKMGEEIADAGGEVRLNAPVTGIRERIDDVQVLAGGQVFTARRLIICGGIQSDRLGRMAGMDVSFRMMPFRGEYYQLPPSRNDVVKHLIYPVPDPELPFLGVHLTRMVDGSVTLGPNAVLGLAREGYPKLSFDVRDVRDMLTFPGFYQVAKSNVRTGWVEMRNSAFKKHYLKACQKYCPSLRVEEMLPYPPGIRAQAVLRDGTLIEDFLFEQTDRVLLVANAPSPAATSAIPISRLIVDRVGASA